jgi:hypothetical protein
VRNDALQLLRWFAHPRAGSGDRFPNAVPRLTSILVAPAATNREPVLAALAAIGPAAGNAVPVIENLANEPGFFEPAARALWWIDRQTNRVWQLAVDRIETDVWAIEVIGDLGPAAAPYLPALKQAITHPRIEIAYASVEAIARIAPGESRLVNQTLVDWVRHPSTPVEFVQRAVELLVERKVTDPVAISAIRRRQHHADRYLAAACRDALTELEEQELSGDSRPAAGTFVIQGRR